MNERNTLKPSCRLGAVYGGCLLSCQPLVGELKGPFSAEFVRLRDISFT